MTQGGVGTVGMRRPPRATAMRGLAARVLRALAESLDGPPPRARAVGQCSVEKLLRGYLGHGPGEPPARLFVLCLGEIRDAFGDEWSRVGPKAMALTASIVAETLHPQDCFSRHGDASLLLMVVERRPGAARLTLRQTLGHLRRRLGGGRDGGSCGVRLRAVTLSDVLTTEPPRPAEAPAAAPDPGPPEDGAGETPEASAARMAERIHRQISFLYRPVWTVGAEEVDTVLCHGMRTADYGTFFGKWVLNGGYDDPFAFGVDLRAVDAAAAHLRATRRVRRRPRVVAPVHYRTLAGEAASRILGALDNRLTAEDRAATVVEVVGPLEGLPLSRLPEITGALRAMGLTVWLRAEPHRVAEILPYRHGVAALGIDLNDLQRGGSPDLAQRRRVLEGLAAALGTAAEAPPPAYVWDVRTVDEARAALVLGAASLAGAAVMADTDAPRASLSLTRAAVGLAEG